jgi:3-hydroxybutyryl-CoA dehydrogenase
MAYFKTSAVVGGGTMGRGIAQILAAAGVQTRLIEKDDAAAQAATDGLTDLLDREVAKWGMTESEKKAILRRVQVGTDLALVAGVSVVVEAIQEEMPAKQALWARIEEICGPDELKITHTATLSISEIASRLKEPARMIGMHFLPPVHKIPVVEIVRGLKTSDRTYQEARELAGLLGKKAVEVTEYPGYITARVILPMLNEAIHALMEGVASADDIDTAMKLGFNFEAGPLHMADRIGLDAVLKWMNALFAELGDAKYRPCPLLRKMVRAGQLGVKTGKGFFEYDAD